MMEGVISMWRVVWSMPNQRAIAKKLVSSWFTPDELEELQRICEAEGCNASDALKLAIAAYPSVAPQETPEPERAVKVKVRAEEPKGVSREEAERMVQERVDKVLEDERHAREHAAEVSRVQCDHRADYSNEEATPRVLEAVNENRGWFGTFHIEDMGDKIHDLGMAWSELTEADRQIVLGTYKAHVLKHGFSEDGVRRSLVEFASKIGAQDPEVKRYYDALEVTGGGEDEEGTEKPFHVVFKVCPHTGESIKA